MRATNAISADEFRSRMGTEWPKRPRGGRVSGAKRGMNKTEAAYAEYLEALRFGAQIIWWTFEGITLKLAHDTRLTPDFAVMMPDGEIVFDDTKGYLEDTARVKLRVACEKFPFRFRLIERDGKGWKATELTP